jgi:cytochrome oxidase assembly protein ShyY1
VKADVPPRPRGLFIPTLVVLVAFAVLLGLGVWQLERLAWKNELIAALTRRMAAPASPLPPRAEWFRLDAATDEFRRVSLRANFRSGREARVYSGAAGLRDDVKGPGYFAFLPARLADGAVVVVNRGFVDNPNPDAALKPLGLSETAVDLVGALRWPEQPGWFVTPYSERQDLWFTRDQRAMAAHYDWGEVAPFYVEQESPTPAGGLPRPGRLSGKLRNDHFGYAMTWFGLAAVLAITFGFWLKGRHRIA